MPPERGFVIELALLDEALKHPAKHLAFGGWRFLNVEQQVAVINHDCDLSSFETGFRYGLLQRCDEFSPRLNAAGSHPTRLNNAGRRSDGLERAVQPTDA